MFFFHINIKFIEIENVTKNEFTRIINFFEMTSKKAFSNDHKKKLIKKIITRIKKTIQKVVVQKKKSFEYESKIEYTFSDSIDDNEFFFEKTIFENENF